MIQIIGLMVGGYILTRYLEMAKGAGLFWGIWLAIMFLLTIFGILDILLTPSPHIPS